MSEMLSKLGHKKWTSVPWSGHVIALAMSWALIPITSTVSCIFRTYNSLCPGSVRMFEKYTYKN